MQIFSFVFLFFLTTLTAAHAQFLGFDNFHEIDPGQYYRSAQLTGREFEKYIQKYGIKTVINLRGESSGDAWYDDEVEALKKHGVLQVDIGMSAKRLPHRQDLLTLLEALENSPRPILVHCKAGVDRTGEASAIYQMLYMGKSREEALEMLGPKYFHFEFFMPAKIYFIENVWQGLQWAYQEYNPCSGQYKHYDTNNPHCQTSLD